MAAANPLIADSPTIEAVAAQAYRIPTDKPEADGTYAWTATTLIVVQIQAGGVHGLGYTYSAEALLALIHGPLTDSLRGQRVFDIPGAWMGMQRAVRNLGRAGLAATAISALDLALWDVKAKLLGQPLGHLLGRCREAVAIYGSGGFTTYSDDQLSPQLSGWTERDGCRWVKMKVGTHPEQDPHRVHTARRAIGDRGLFVDANGAYSASQALELARVFGQAGVRWFEEPVSSDDLSGLHAIRARVPDGMEVAAGEYGYTADYFRAMLEAQAVHVLQADVTRCGGITGFLKAAALADAHHIPLSAHCAPAAHLALGCALPALRHLEWFHDHARIEQLLFDGAPSPQDGLIRPDLSRPGLGLEFKTADAERFRCSA